MKDYVATFHTHLSALMTCRNLKNSGVDACMMPVFRKLSSSCGTCVVYTADGLSMGSGDEANRRACVERLCRLADLSLQLNE